jgi:acetoin utilization protein AcuB
MTPSPFSIGRDQSMASAAVRMREHGVRHLPVLHGGHVVGVVSERDLALVESLPGVDPHALEVAEAMTADPYEVAPTDRLAPVLAHMAAHKLGTALVVDGGHCVGIITTTDVVRALAALLAGATD